MQKERVATFDEACDALAAFVHGGAAPGARERSALGRSYAPEAQVTGRFELRGPRCRGGVDVRGDGTAEAYTGWIRKRVVERRGDETAVQALRRALSPA